MLILGRKLLEVIDYHLPNGDVISVQVTRIGGNIVRLGTVAPDYVKVMRREVPVKRAELDHSNESESERKDAA